MDDKIGTEYEDEQGMETLDEEQEPSKEIAEGEDDFQMMDEKELANNNLLDEDIPEEEEDKEDKAAINPTENESKESANVTSTKTTEKSGYETPEEDKTTKSKVAKEALDKFEEIKKAEMEADAIASVAAVSSAAKINANATAANNNPSTQIPGVSSTEVETFKMFLKQSSEKTDMNLYDHLTNILLKVLQERPHNAIDYFENISYEVKRATFLPESYYSPRGFKRVKDNVKGKELAKAQVDLFTQSSDPLANPEEGGELPDIMDIGNMFEWAGVSLGREETYLIFLSIKRLALEKKLKSVRLWGKILGIRKDYIIVEAEVSEATLTDEDDMDDDYVGGEEDGETAEGQEDVEDVNMRSKKKKLSEHEAVMKEMMDELDDPTLPKLKYKPPIALPKEVGIGVNKYRYFVCNYAGGPWTLLPNARPQDIQIARRIRKYFTGELKTKMMTYPKFNGLETHYLRAQIARIAAATVVSPSGYYIFDPEETEEDGENSMTIIVNPDFEGVANEALINLNNWVHHVPYILPQGRTTWVNPVSKQDKDGRDNEEEGEEDEEGSQPEVQEENSPETGPTILSPVARDEDQNEMAAWSGYLSSKMTPTKYTPVFLRSTRWPGAVTVAYNEKFANLYVGDGMKDLGGKIYHDESLRDVENEFGTEKGPGNRAAITEEKDASVEDEKAFEDMLRAEGNHKEDEMEESMEEDSEEDENE